MTTNQHILRLQSGNLGDWETPGGNGNSKSPGVLNPRIPQQIPLLAFQHPADRLKRREADRLGVAGLEDRGLG